MKFILHISSLGLSLLSVAFIWLTVNRKNEIEIAHRPNELEARRPLSVYNEPISSSQKRKFDALLRWARLKNKCNLPGNHNTETSKTKFVINENGAAEIVQDEEM